MTSDVYDSDDALKRSPGLKPTIINYKPDNDIPPFPHKPAGWRDGKGDIPSSPGSSDGRSRKPRRPHNRPQPTLADEVLMKSIDPNRPDIARIAAEHPLTIDYDSDEEEAPPPTSKPKQDASRPSEASDLGQAAASALSLLTPYPEAVDRRRPAVPDHEPLPSVSEMLSSSSTFLKRPPQRTSISTPSDRGLEETLATSRVGRYAISPSEIPAQELLPALQSPSQSTSGSPEMSQNLQSLPSLQTTLEALSETRLGSLPPAPFGMPDVSSPPARPGPSPRERQLSGPRPAATQMPSPLSQLSPMSSKDSTTLSPASQTPLWRQSVLLKPDISNMTSPYEPSPLSAKSPAGSYPTPTEVRPPQEEHPEASSPTGNQYKCSFPGCTAAPFQTQYLLNSHANVHSQDRPHFCPVSGCPRGFGGKGFKRKNEMIRHGLVHDSPGYVCPFCTDQLHRYPRPDNLQRHVRVHHVDKSKDDDKLRMVLAQRPEGSTRRGRRRTQS